MMDLPHWLGLAAAIFAAGFLDAIAGGGGLISLPAFLAAGLPAPLALGTNKLVAVTGSLTSTLRYARDGLVHHMTPGLAVLSLAGALLGAHTALAIPERVLRTALIVLLVAALAAVLLRRQTDEKTPLAPRRAAWLWTGAAAIGFYDGFFGPGTGTFLIALFVAAGGLPLPQAAGSAKLLNFASNLGAACLFAFRGAALPLLALSLIPVMIAGSWLGASLAVRRGTPLIRALLTVSTLSLCAKLAWDLWRG